MKLKYAINHRHFSARLTYTPFFLPRFWNKGKVITSDTRHHVNCNTVCAMCLLPSSDNQNCIKFAPKSGGNFHNDVTAGDEFWEFEILLALARVTCMKENYILKFSPRQSVASLTRACVSTLVKIRKWWWVIKWDSSSSLIESNHAIMDFEGILFFIFCKFVTRNVSEAWWHRCWSSLSLFAFKLYLDDNSNFMHCTIISNQLERCILIRKGVDRVQDGKLYVREGKERWRAQRDQKEASSSSV